VLDQVHVRPTDRAVVLGDGKLGLLVAQVLALSGAETTLVGRHPAKLSIGRQRGVLACTSADLLPGNWDVVVECTGRREGFSQAQKLVRPGGHLVLKSTYHGRVEADLSGLVVDEIHAVGSRCGPFPAAIRLLQQGWVDVRSLLEAEYALDDALAAFEHAARPGTLKIVVRP
jgi:threonine dehydrogenase-like Zn-dependent dehydrogenase